MRSLKFGLMGSKDTVLYLQDALGRLYLEMKEYERMLECKNYSKAELDAIAVQLSRSLIARSLASSDGCVQIRRLEHPNGALIQIDLTEVCTAIIARSPRQFGSR